MSDEKQFVCSATMKGECTISVIAKTKKEAIQKIKNGDFEANIDDWDVDEIEYETLEW